MEKLQKTAKALDAFFRITYRIVMILNILALVIIALSLYLCLGDSDVLRFFGNSLITSLDFGSIRFQIAPEALQSGSAGSIYFLSTLLVGLGALAVYMLMIRNVRALLAPMKEGLPFDSAVAHSFRNLGWLTIAQGILTLIQSGLLQGSILKAYNLAELFLNENINAVTTYYNFDFTFVIAALVFFGLSYIFHYGQELQQLSDETL